MESPLSESKVMGVAWKSRMGEPPNLALSHAVNPAVATASEILRSFTGAATSIAQRGRHRFDWPGENRPAQEGGGREVVSEMQSAPLTIQTGDWRGGHRDRGCGGLSRTPPWPATSTRQAALFGGFNVDCGAGVGEGYPPLGTADMGRADRRTCTFKVQSGTGLEPVLTNSVLAVQEGFRASHGICLQGSGA